MSRFERYLTLWVAACIVVGVGLGHLLPGLFHAIGAIQITDRFSLVEVPAEIADSIIETLRATTIKGKRVPVRRDHKQDWKS